MRKFSTMNLPLFDVPLSHSIMRPSISYGYGGAYGVAKDEQLGFQWMQKAADANHPPAWKDLSKMYEDGQGVAKNPEEAKKWREKAEKAGVR